jgi:hypothetical protein|tara:strand:+ start:76 stop:930 length:855 start_codon:yes stop_codon:yes gene_type:complete
MKILVCTIVRNAELTIPRWWENVTQMTALYPEIEFSLSVYENDSIDNSKNLLTERMKDSSAYFSETFLGMEDINTQFYQSVVNDNRVDNLARARNNCFNQVNNLEEYDYAFSVEVDTHFTVSSLGLLFQKIGQWDILSLTSYTEPSLNPSPFYDHWATRLTDKEDMWDNEITEDVPLFKSPLSSLHPKTLVSNKIDAILPVYATFNLLCLYRMKPILEGCRFSGYSERLESFDCDTTVICEQFHQAGYHKIGMMPHIEVFNDPFYEIAPQTPLSPTPRTENCCN